MEKPINAKTLEPSCAIQVSVAVEAVNPLQRIVEIKEIISSTNGKKDICILGSEIEEIIAWWTNEKKRVSTPNPKD